MTECRCGVEASEECERCGAWTCYNCSEFDGSADRILCADCWRKLTDDDDHDMACDAARGT